MKEEPIGLDVGELVGDLAAAQDWIRRLDGLRVRAEKAEARVVELEAALAAAEIVEQELQGRISQLSREKDVAIQFWKSAGINTTAAANARAGASEARATALLEALRPFADEADISDAIAASVHQQFGDEVGRLVPLGDLRAARAAINAGASNDRK